MSALKSRLAIGLTGFPLVVLAVLNGGWIFNSLIVLSAAIAFKEFLSLKSENDNTILWVLFGSIYVLGSLFCLLVLRDIDASRGSYFTLMLFAGVSVNDSFSYIFGKWIGGKKIAPSQVTGEKRSGRKIGISGDTRPTDKLVEFFKNCDYLSFDSTFADELKEKAVETNHSTAKEAAELAEKANVSTLILTHFSARYNDESVLLKEAKEIHNNTITAKDLLEVNIL